MAVAAPSSTLSRTTSPSPPPPPFPLLLSLSSSYSSRARPRRLRSSPSPSSSSSSSSSSLWASSRRIRCSIDRQALFSRVAPVYDNLNDVLSLGQHRVWKRMAVSWSGAKMGDRVLDLCCGSGDLTFLLSQKVGADGEVIALDFSRVQLSIASTRQELYWKACYKNIKWVEGDALDLPFTDCYFDAITLGYGLRNLVDKPKAMQEILRVLKPGSRASILDFNKSSSTLISSFQNWAIDNAVVPLASSYGLLEEYKYLKDSIAEFLTGKELEKLAKDVGFCEAKHYEIAGGLMANLVATR